MQIRMIRSVMRLLKSARDPPSGKVGTGSSHTDYNGQTTFNVRISSDADTGTFDVGTKQHLETDMLQTCCYIIRGN